MFTIPSSVFSHSGGSGASVEFLQQLQGRRKGDTLEGVNQLKQYLQRYGYLRHGENHEAAHANDNEFDEIVESALKTYQLNYHLDASGVLDTQTIEQMMKPRCGVPDIIDGTTRMQSGMKKKTIMSGNGRLHIFSHYSFFPGNPRWPRTKTHLTYRFIFSVEMIGLVRLRPLMSRAFAQWAAVSRFTFAEALPLTKPDLVIGFERGSHGDGADFDGPGGGIAHAASPTYGLLHFDADEKWSTKPVPDMDEFDLETIAVHEIGHLLGLDHSADTDAIMFPSFSLGEVKRQLNQDDIQGIQALYSLP